jgi:hypothetical protein
VFGTPTFRIGDDLYFGNDRPTSFVRRLRPKGRTIDMTPKQPLMLVTGVGPGTGSAIVRRFVARLSRRHDCARPGLTCFARNGIA